MGPTGPQNQNNHALLKFCFRNVTKRIHLIHDFNQNRKKKKTKQLPLGSDVLLTKHKGFFLESYYIWNVELTNVTYMSDVKAIIQ